MEKRSYKYLVFIGCYVLFLYGELHTYKNLGPFTLVDTIVDNEDSFDSLYFYF